MKKKVYVFKHFFYYLIKIILFLETSVHGDQEHGGSNEEPQEAVHRLQRGRTHPQGNIQTRKLLVFVCDKKYTLKFALMFALSLCSCTTKKWSDFVNKNKVI